MVRFEGGTLYPSDYFSPIDYSTKERHITMNTISIHHYDATWITKKEKIREKMTTVIEQILYKVGGYEEVVALPSLPHIMQDLRGLCEEVAA